MISVAAHNVLISRPDTRVEAFDWMRATLPPKTKIAIEDYTIRDRRRERIWMTAASLTRI